MPRGKDAELFSAKHLFLNYIPKRVAIFIIPVALLLAYMNKGTTSWLIFAIYSVIMIITQIYNYVHAANRHADLYAEHGEEYLDILNDKMKSVGQNELINRFWTGLEPKENE